MVYCCALSLKLHLVVFSGNLVLSPYLKGQTISCVLIFVCVLLFNLSLIRINMIILLDFIKYCLFNLAFVICVPLPSSFCLLLWFVVVYRAGPS